MSCLWYDRLRLSESRCDVGATRGLHHRNPLQPPPAPAVFIALGSVVCRFNAFGVRLSERSMAGGQGQRSLPPVSTIPRQLPPVGLWE